jgi:hypothetical protein
MKVKARKSTNTSAVSYIADLTAELAAIAAAEGHQHLAQILRMAYREAQGLCAGSGRNGAGGLADRGDHVH